MAPWSPAGRAAAAMALSATLAAALTAVATRWLGPPPAFLTRILLVTPLILWLARRMTHPWVRVLRAVRDAILSLRDQDFSVSIGAASDPELAGLVSAYNSLGEVLRRERLNLYQA